MSHAPFAALPLALAAALALVHTLQDRPDPAPAAARLFRVIVPVADLDRAQVFYEELLQVEGLRVSPGRHYLHCGGTIVALVNPVADGDEGEAVPLPDHLYFAVADLEAAFARAERLGGLAEGQGDGNLPLGEIATRPWGERSFYLRDPFGTPLCLVDETTCFTGR